MQVSKANANQAGSAVHMRGDKNPGNDLTSYVGDTALKTMVLTALAMAVLLPFERHATKFVGQGVICHVGFANIPGETETRSQYVDQTKKKEKQNQTKQTKKTVRSKNQKEKRTA